METPSGIRPEHLSGLKLRREAAARLIAWQPATVRDALQVPGVGRSTTAVLLALGLLSDPDGVQGPRSAATKPSKPAARRAAASSQWAFAPRFRRGGMGWRSKPAVQRVREAVAEIVREARRDPLTAAGGAVLFLEKLSPALERVDSSSGAIGTAVNRAIEALVPIVASAPADRKARDRWLERLWEAISEDEIPYLETLGDFWGELCASSELACLWADRLKPIVELSWSPDPTVRGYFKGTAACLSSLLAAGRHTELLDLLDKAPHPYWHDRKYGFRALVAMGRRDEALRYAESSRGPHDNPIEIARACEEVFLGSGLAEEAYERHAYDANVATSRLATFRAVAKKYPHKQPTEILQHLVASTPGEEGKWFAAAKDAGLLTEAILLARTSPCDPRTLIRATREYAGTHPRFALEAGLTALHWIMQGHGFDITVGEVATAITLTVNAAEKAGCRDETCGRIRGILASDTHSARFFLQHLRHEVGLT